MTDQPDRGLGSGRLRQALKTIRAKPVLFSCAAVIAAVVIASPAELAFSTRLLIGWNAGICLYLALTWRMMLRSDVHLLRRRAALEDEAEWLILMLTAIAALASLAAIAVELHGVRSANSTSQACRIALAASTILVSWFFLHTILALHYAHDYYASEKIGRGLRFPDHIKEPSYWDFLYVSFTIGAASQTSDVTIASPKIRRVALAHTILSFLFNTTILALAINVGASLL
jgi:uncharacterized membrane protein